MRKTGIILAVAFAFIACEDEIKYNNPALQAYQDYELWQASEKTATVVNGDLLIQGIKDLDTLKITIPNYSFGNSYSFDGDNPATATFVKTTEENTFYYVSGIYDDLESEITLDTADKQVPGTITGTFRIEFTDSQTNSNSTFHDGVLYRIPITQP